MAKLALCIKRADAPQAVIDAFKGNIGRVLEIDPSFWYTPVELVDRAICETDETYLQLLPYIAVNTNDDSVFMYTRGGGGEEARLHGNYSIGVGGHVDIAPNDCCDLLSVIRSEARREIQEEIAVDVPSAELTPTFFICDPTNPVGRVHLGLLIGIQLPEATAIDFVNGLEAGSIENARSITAAELAEEPVNSRLENWSKLVAVALVDESVLLSSSTPEGDADWDNPETEVGGELIAGEEIGATYRASECDDAAVDSEDEDGADDGDDEEILCSECDEYTEDCVCEHTEVDDADETDGVPADKDAQ